MANPQEGQQSSSKEQASSSTNKGKKKSPKRITRQLRDRSLNPKRYTDDIHGDADDYIEGPQSFTIEEKLETNRFNVPLVKELKGTEFDLAYIQKHGFTTPLLFKDKTGLGIRVPGPNFSVSDVRTCVGSKRMLDVMDVLTQKNLEMNMKEWEEYYENTKDRDRLLNVISLEFSHTKLENYIESPTVVRQLDWVDRVWPRNLKNMQTESTNVIDEMMYPKVQKYCLMSVKKCYTDFHVDFGGTSVWYHILKGAKVFWLIPPTEKNLELYQSWILSGKQGDCFFGDNVEECGRVYLNSGDTFFIPSGWIHAVYTPKDSLVFGGNFLHSFGIDRQIRIANIEEATKVPQKFRYPFFTEMLWYTLNRYVHCLLGFNFVQNPNETEEEKKEFSSKGYYTENRLVPEPVHLSPQELLGLKSIVLYLHQLPIPRKNVPAIIKDPVELLRAVRHIVSEHRFDNPDKAVTGLPILIWPGEKPQDVGKIQILPVTVSKCKTANANSNTSNVSDPNSQPGSSSDSVRAQLEVLNADIFLRRVPCNNCQCCLNPDDCQQCVRCVRRKGICLMRECMKPLLPNCSTCCECGLDGWNEIPGPSAFPIKRMGSSNILECSICFKITHALCVPPTKAIGIVSEDLPNSWECPLCLEKDANGQYNNISGRLSNGRRQGTFESRESTGNVHQMIQPIPVIVSSSSNAPASANGILNKEEDRLIPVIKKEPELKKVESITSTIIARKPAGKRPSLHLDVKEEPDTEKEHGKKKEKQRKVMQNSPKTLKNRIKEKEKESCPKGSATGSSTKIVRNKTNGKGGINNTTTSKSVKEVEDDEDEIEDDESEEGEQSSTANRISSAPATKNSPIKFPHRSQLASKIMNKSAKSLKAPSQVVRPADIGKEELKSGTNQSKAYWKEQDILLKVFSYFDLSCLRKSLGICKDWNRVGVHPSLWKHIDLSHRKINVEVMRGVTRRQPSSLTLDWSNVSYQQLHWLLCRIPQLKELSLQGIPWLTVSILKSCICPTLTILNLAYVSGLTDCGLREILSPPVDSRPGLTDAKCRLRSLKSLNLSGASISDVSLRYITEHAGGLTTLELSSCSRITDAGIAQLGSPDSPTLSNLESLNLSGCLQLTNISLEHLRKIRNLKYLDIRNVSQIQYSALCKYLSQLTGKSKILVRSDFNTKYPGFGSGSSSFQQNQNYPNSLSSSILSQNATANGGGSQVQQSSVNNPSFSSPSQPPYS